MIKEWFLIEIFTLSVAIFALLNGYIFFGICWILIAFFGLYLLFKK